MTGYRPSASPHNLNAHCDELSDALQRGLITDSEWYERRKKATAIAYLSRDNPRAQSGHGGAAVPAYVTVVAGALSARHTGAVHRKNAARHSCSGPRTRCEAAGLQASTGPFCASGA